jgi:hypothetical protein
MKTAEVAVKRVPAKFGRDTGSQYIDLRSEIGAPANEGTQRTGRRGSYL